jgi:predicted permease
MNGLPKFAVAVLERLVRNPVAREGLLGDLEERYRRRRGWRAGRRFLWLWREVMGAGVRYVVASRAHRQAHGGEAGLRGGGGANLVDGFLQDARYALRGVRQRPGFALLVVGTLALGIGANTAMFSMVNSALIRKPPYRDADQLVRIYTDTPEFGPYRSSTFADYRDMRGLEDTFEEVGLFESVFSQVELERETVRVMGEVVSHTLLPMLGVEPILGRSFLPEEDEVPGEVAVVLLGHGFWQRAFGGDREILGKPLRIAGRSYTVIGVTPEWFQSLAAPGLTADIILPAAMSAALTGSTSTSRFTSRTALQFNLLGRLREGIGPKTAAIRLEALADRLRRAFPEIPEGRTFSLVPEGDVTLGPRIDGILQSIAALLLAVVGLVLLLACTNLASFLLARASGRRTEVAVRVAMGARRGRLVRQLLTETTLLALAGGAVGLLVAHWTLRLIMGFQPPLPVTFTLDWALDRNVLLFTLGVSVAAGVLFGLAPAVQGTRTDVAPILRDETGTGRQRKFGMRNGLIAVQMAVSVVLLFGAGLFLRSLTQARDLNVGFRSEGAAMVWLDAGHSGIPRPEFPALAEELGARARSLPGVTSVTVTADIPLALSSSSLEFRIPGVPNPEGREGHRILRERVDHAFFETMGVRLLAGRGFTPQDRSDAPRVAIVNETAAHTYWPEGDPVGREIFPGGPEQGYQIVGVAADTKVESITEPPKPLVYLALAQQGWNDFYVVARGGSDPSRLAGALRRTAREVDPRLMVMEAKTLDEMVGVHLFPFRAAALLLGVFGLLALALASIGLYGVVSFSAARRTREVGIRMSLGARRRAVVRMVLGHNLTVVAVGGLVGLALAVGLAQLIRSFLVGVGPSDPVTLLSVPVLLGAVAAVAAFIPAFRASRVDPVEALRRE